MVFLKLFQNRPQVVCVKTLLTTEQDRLVEMVQIADMIGEEPALDRGEGNRADHGLLALLMRSFVQQGRKLGNGGMMEQVPHFHLPSRAHQPAGHLDGLDGIAAQVKIVVVNPDRLLGQHPLPYAGEKSLRVALRRNISLARFDVNGLRRGQCPAIHLAVDGEGQSVEPDDVGRDHVIRQGFGEMGPQFRRGQGIVARHICDQLRCADGGLPGDHHGRLNLGMPQQPFLDLARFHTEAAHLDLIVHAADKFDGAVRAPAS